MKKLLLLIAAGIVSISAMGGTPIVYNGDSLTLNKDFKRTQTGWSPKTMVEISGMACSRTTPGYLWAQSDDNYRVIAMDEKGSIQLDILLKNRPSRSDWEDMCLGMYQGKLTLFVGGFGDNNLKHADDNYIFYFDEPAIPTTAGKDTIKIGNQYIKFGYPDGKAHDAEAMFYDNVEQMMYIVDKVDNTCASVFSLRMDTTYGTDLQTLTKVCELGLQDEWQFMRVTAADITQDGKYLIIKNYDVYHDRAYALLWTREGEESVGEMLQRQPEQINAYLLEWQGEAVAWLDSTTFYTTSDEDGSAPIFKYVRWGGTDVEELPAEPETKGTMVMINGQLFIRSEEKMYSVNGQMVR